MKAAMVTSNCEENGNTGFQADLANLKADMAVLKWMAGVNIAANVAVILKLFLH